MTDLDKRRLREIEVREKDQVGLSSLSDEFYAEAQALVDDLKAEYEEYDDPRSNEADRAYKRYQRARDLRESIWHIRGEKIAQQATGREQAVDEGRLADKEVELYNTLKQQYQQIGASVLDGSDDAAEDVAATSGSGADEGKSQTTTEGENIEEEEDKDYVAIRMLEDQSNFVDLDGHVWEDIKAGDVITPPRPNAQPFLNHDVAEIVDENFASTDTEEQDGQPEPDVTAAGVDEDTSASAFM